MYTNALLSEPRNQQQPSYADVIQGIRQEQSSAATVMQALQVMVESMQTMMNRMTTLIEALTLQLSATGIKQMATNSICLVLFSSRCSSPDLVAIIYIQFQLGRINLKISYNEGFLSNFSFEPLRIIYKPMTLVRQRKATIFM